MKMQMLRGLLAALCVASLGALLGAKETAEVPDRAKPAAPATIKLADGKKVPIVSVIDLNSDPKAHKGLMAIDGQVGEVYADKGRFMLMAYGEGVCSDEGCEGCAADQQVPIRYDKAKLTGKLPKKDQKIYVVAVVTPTETGGYTLELRGIMAEGKTLLSIKP